MEYYRIWRILRGHKSVLIWLPLIAACVGLTMSYILPEQYECTALVLVKSYEDIKFNPNEAASKEVVDFPVNVSAPIDALSKTYMEVVKSPAVAVRIVDALQLDKPKPKHYTSSFAALKDTLSTWVKNTLRTLRNYCKYGRDIPASPHDQAVEDLEKNLTVTAKKDTYSFEISDRSSNPQEAAAIANMAAQIFVEHSSAAYRRESARTGKFIAKQVDESRTALEQARAAILAYKNSGGTFDLKTEYDEKLRDLLALQDTLVQDQGKVAGLKRLAGKFTPNLMAQEVEVAELKRHIGALRSQLTAYPEKEKRMNALVLAERVAQENYEFFLKQYEEARVNESANINEIRVASPAMPSLYPVKPVKYVYAALSFATALLVAIGWALFVETLYPRVRTLRDLDAELGMPVLGAIPMVRNAYPLEFDGRPPAIDLVPPDPNV